MSIIETKNFSEFNDELRLDNLYDILKNWIKTDIKFETDIPDRFIEMVSKDVVRVGITRTPNLQKFEVFLYDWDGKTQIRLVIGFNKFAIVTGEIIYWLVDHQDKITEQIDVYDTDTNIINRFKEILVDDIIPSILKTPENHIALVFQNLIDDELMCDVGFVPVYTKKYPFGYMYKIEDFNTWKNMCSDTYKQLIRIDKHSKVVNNFLHINITWLNVSKDFIIPLDDLVELELLIRQIQLKFMDEINKMGIAERENPY